jgi:AcrR family transcriptional regulator
VGANEPAGRERVRRADARRNIDAIVEAAARTLAANPRAVMQDIAAEAGLHRATVHRHFPTRDDLIVAVRRRALDAVAVVLRDVVDRAGAPVEETLGRVTSALLEVGDRYRLYLYTTWQDASIEERRGELSDPVIDLLTTGQSEGVVRRDLPVPQLNAAYGGLIWAALPHIASGDMTMDEALRFVVVMIGSPTD